MAHVAVESDDIPHRDFVFLAKNIKCRTYPCTVTLSCLEYVPSILYMNLVFGSFAVSVNLLDLCLCLALVPLCMGAVIGYIGFSQSY